MVKTGVEATLNEKKQVEEEKKGLIAWINAHKKQLLFVAGISFTTLIGIVIGMNNKEAIVALWTSLEKKLMATPQKITENMNLGTLITASSEVEETVLKRAYTAPQMAFDVSQHIRNLSGGRHHSAEKAAEAMAKGIELLPNQTLVSTYIKNAA